MGPTYGNWYHQQGSCGSVVECLTRDRDVACPSFTGGIALCTGARHFILCLVLVQHKKTRPDMAEKMLTGTYRINTNKNSNRVEAVKRRAAVFMTGDYCYTSRDTAMTNTLAWETLQHRRQQANAILMYRIVHCLVGIPAS